MLTTRTKSKSGRGNSRRGFALYVLIVIVAVLAVLATVITVNLTGDNDQKRIARAADILKRFELELIGVIPSFDGQVTQYPGLLSLLVTKPIVTSPNSCFWGNSSKTLTSFALWRGPYHLIPIPTTGYNLSPGFFAQDQLVRDAPDATNQTGTLGIVMNNVSLADAKGLGLKIDGKDTGAGVSGPGGGTAGFQVKFTINGNNPVQVTYLMPITGC